MRLLPVPKKPLKAVRENVSKSAVIRKMCTGSKLPGKLEHISGNFRTHKPNVK